MGITIRGEFRCGDSLPSPTGRSPARPTPSTRSPLILPRDCCQKDGGVSLRLSPPLAYAATYPPTSKTTAKLSTEDAFVFCVAMRLVLAEGQCMPRSGFETCCGASSAMSLKNDSSSSRLDLIGPKTSNLDDLLTPAQFALCVGESESWVRWRLASLPGVIREGRKHIRIHPRTYPEKRLGIGRTEASSRR